MQEAITYVGLDVHQSEIAVALLEGRARRPEEFRIGGDARGVRKLLRRLQKVGGEVECAYEAGPCGYALQRQLEGAGIACAVVAPSLIPVKPGERIKTDRRDARKLAEQLRAGTLTAVCAPDESQEAVRDLCRCREAAREDLMRARHRLSKMLLRRGLVYRAGNNWTQKHRRWLLTLAWELEAERVVFGDYLGAIEQLEERLRGLDAALETQSGEDPGHGRRRHLQASSDLRSAHALLAAARRPGGGELAVSYLDSARAGSIDRRGRAGIKLLCLRSHL